MLHVTCLLLLQWRPSGSFFEKREYYTSLLDRQGSTLQPLPCCKCATFSILKGLMLLAEMEGVNKVSRIVLYHVYMYVYMSILFLNFFSIKYISAIGFVFCNLSFGCWDICETLKILILIHSLENMNVCKTIPYRSTQYLLSYLSPDQSPKIKNMYLLCICLLTNTLHPHSDK